MHSVLSSIYISHVLVCPVPSMRSSSFSPSHGRPPHVYSHLPSLRTVLHHEGDVGGTVARGLSIHISALPDARRVAVTMRCSRAGVRVCEWSARLPGPVHAPILTCPSPSPPSHFSWGCSCSLDANLPPYCYALRMMRPSSLLLQLSSICLVYRLWSLVIYEASHQPPLPSPTRYRSFPSTTALPYYALVVRPGTVHHPENQAVFLCARQQTLLVDHPRFLTSPETAKFGRSASGCNSHLRVRSTKLSFV